MKQSSEITEWSNVTKSLFFKEIVPLNQPAVLKGLVKDWPIVIESNKSIEAAVEYLTSFDNHNPVYTIVGEPEIKGRFFYSKDLKNVNFQRIQGAITAILEQLTALQNNPHPHAIAIQAADIKDVLPGFEKDNLNPVLNSDINPTLWLGNQAIVAPHYDVHDNIACVVSGRRTFTLYPPDQIENLYVGPTLNAPGGVPISLVNTKNPDFSLYPNYETAVENSQTATLEPGDAIFIPTPWWHSVESLEKINILVNYWWGGLDSGTLSPTHSLMHSMLTIAKLPLHQRKSWQDFFNYFVFDLDEKNKDHLPNDLNDLITKLDSEQRETVLNFLRNNLR